MAIFNSTSYVIGQDALRNALCVSREWVETLSQALAVGALYPQGILCFTPGEGLHKSIPANPTPGTMIQFGAGYILARYQGDDEGWRLCTGVSVMAPGITSDEIPMIFGRKTITSEYAYKIRKERFGF